MSNSTLSPAVRPAQTAIVIPAPTLREQLQDLIRQADARTLGIPSPAEVAETVMTPDDWDEQAFYTAITQIEALGSHYIGRAQARWEGMARAAAARVAAMANATPDEDDQIAF
jgi:hypothetical protein